MGIKPFKFWCQTVLPTVYDDSLSYYELLCKVVRKLNETIEVANTTNVGVTQLTDFVNNYFTNLDVQTEINNKLDQMAESGELANIINEQLFNELNENLNNLDVYTKNYVKNNEINTNVIYENNNLIYETKIKPKNIGIISTNPNPRLLVQAPRRSVQQTSVEHDYPVMCNCCLSGIIIVGDNYDDSRRLDGERWNYLVFDGTKITMIDNINQKPTVAQLRYYGNYAGGIWSQLIRNGEAVNFYEEVGEDTDKFEDICLTKHPRQILCVDNDDNIVIYSVAGRVNFSEGMNYTDMINFLSIRNIKNAWNLDGGGSVQTVVNQSNITYLFDLDTSNPSGRPVYPALFFEI